MRDDNLWAGERVLITGGAGFVGAPLVRRLRAEGADPVVLDDFSMAARDRLPADVAVAEADLRDGPAVAAAVAEVGPTVCVHLAAIHFIPRCRAEPADTLAVNVLGTQHLLDALAEHAVGCRLVAISTGDVYRPDTTPHREDAVCDPDNVYGLSKLTDERLVTYWVNAGHGTAAIARLFNVYGPGETNPHLIPEIMGQLHRGDTLHLGNLDAARDYVYVDDVVEALIGLTGVDGPCALTNLGTGEAHTVHEVLATIERLRGRAVTVVADPERMRPSDRPVLCPDTNRLRSLLPRFAPRGLAAGLEALLAAEGLLGSSPAP